MKIYKQKYAKFNFLFCVILTALIACAQGAVENVVKAWATAEKLDFFYRGFDETAPLRFSEDEMLSAAKFKGYVTKESELSRFIGELSGACDAVGEPSEEQMDLHVLIKAHGKNGKEMRWKASPFHFYDSTVGKVCVLKPKDSERLSALMQKLSAAK
ncbi:MULTISPECIES: hypothetical protein [Xanthomonas]|uniref:hypothetical protein n=1 Tax=Xanthomonas TaxID=338 RepID=UPI0006E5CA42|nr:MULTISPECIES: hypothetical protein [Xanthomonas]MBO9746656.1 hypothetical protein [Xanthomonas phaseoli pv. dieffenbachiae]MBO9753415.1 hypothetical protein [Xanthomonas phaseoli pv. dieffenbachiae]MBO9879760.1 hypothetical protein [Xanthomonas sp. D-99]MBO9891042.1 hypothetical protein [Xanthomonas sp. D-36-1]OQP73014.1 hypothetical protein IB69_016640 [Xanthomonas citri]